MLFPTIEFAVFFSIIFPLTWALNSQNTIRKLFLVLASYFFYGFWSTAYLAVLAAISVCAFLIAALLARQSNRLIRLSLLWLGVIASIGVLAYFKYYNFLIANLMNSATALGFTIDLPFVELAIPVAISFITFHAIAYVVDVYNKKLPPSSSLIDIMLYLSFFPHLIAGPIVRPKPFLDQLAKPPSPAGIKIGMSAFLIIGGLLKKVLIANYIGTDFVDPIFRAPQDYSSTDLLLGMYGYAIQIYCDFSAYTDIAIGIANLLGYEFPENFNQPYRALTVQDFWRRWHITLSNWLRDYLYIPLGGNRDGKWRTYFNILATMALGGLWHGANSTFLIWGLMHGAALVVERAFGITGTANPRRRFMPAPLARLVTFHFLCVTWIFFRAPSFESAIAYLDALISDLSFSTTVTPLVATMLFLGAVTQLFPTPLWNYCVISFERAPVALKVAGSSLALFLISVAAPVGVPPFIYYQF
jgi:alginate O-acetyltransferase complex protein AlgI